MGRTSDARERLLHAALDLIWTRTYDAVGVEAICQAAEVKKGSFYHFFASKEDLAAQALEGHWEHSLSAMRRIFAAEKDPLERLFDYFDQVRRFNVERRAGGGCICGCPYLHVGAEMVQGSERITRTVHRILAGHFAFFRQAISDARDAAKIDPGADVELLARAVFALFEGTLVLARVHNDLAYLDDLIPGTKRILGVTAEGMGLPGRR